MSDVIIRAENLGKQYHIGAMQVVHRYKTFRDALSNVARAPVNLVKSAVNGRSNAPRDDTIWALKDVSFEVKQGEVIGVIGRNGAGKSTLLKVLTRITEPTEGQVEIHGRVGSLLEVGTGFHPELTGRENIYLNGAILGMKRAEINSKFEEIVDFSGVERFLDTPVKYYSSGMQVRLAFSVAAHLEPEILLIDEVLAVGDAEFQRKCLGKMEGVAKTGRTILFVSHNMGAISSLCQKCILINSGQLVTYGSTEETIERYLTSLRDQTSISIGDRRDRVGSGKLRFIGLRCIDGKDGQEIQTLQTGSEAQIEITFRHSLTRKDIPSITLGLSLISAHGQTLLLCRNDYTGDAFREINAIGQATCIIPKLPVVPGIYGVNLYAEIHGEVQDWIQAAAQIEVIEGDFYGTGRLPPPGYDTALVEHRWVLK